jgi:hypothetical protein
MGQLEVYQQRRDDGAPTVAPSNLAATQTTIGALDLDVLTWEYSNSANPLLGDVLADAFAIFWEHALTDSPRDGGVIVLSSVRTYSMFWPTGADRSYAIQPVRFCHRGIVAGGLSSSVAWMIT